MIVLPDAEQVTSRYLQTVPELLELFDDEPRVYTALPKAPAFPAVRITRIGGAPVSQPLHLDAARIQVDVWGGSKYEAGRVVETVRGALVEMNEADHDGAVVSGVTFGPLRYLPDQDFTPARPRFIAAVTVYLHPGPTGS